MKILVVGGTGLIGGHAALHLRSLGHDLTIAARKPAATGSALTELPFLGGDYVANDFTRADLHGFDALVFTAGNDVRHVPADENEGAHWVRANAQGVPRFFAAARDAGIRHAVNVGSFYPQAAPDVLRSSSYARSRKMADDGVRALAASEFRVMSVNAPFVVGTVPGLVVPMFEAYTRYAEGLFAPMPEFAPPGGVNFISAQSLSEAIAGALNRGQSGVAYLVGDENLSYQEYFGHFFRAVGKKVPPIIDQEHTMLPDSALLAGRGNSIFYEPDPAEARLLGYRRNDIARTVDEIVSQFRTRNSA